MSVITVINLKIFSLYLSNCLFSFFNMLSKTISNKGINYVLESFKVILQRGMMVFFASYFAISL
jgi:hypothetical protein